ncbi:hypothetical protein [Rhizohabitans arisaemae]|uniref:hypothetical protein n=1 Tax=Rhizohabitans arisaemae TaxID=2720610 RepID=UPI0024B11AA2|nr:hypothetical protein [Rhizohabitans arisaemae]
MSEFVFRVTEETREQLEWIAEELQRFGMSRAEAVARINHQWHGSGFAEGADSLLGHELPEYWATLIYYVDVPDWSDGVDRSSWPVLDPPPRGSMYWTLDE